MYEKNALSCCRIKKTTNGNRCNICEYIIIRINDYFMSLPVPTTESAQLEKTLWVQQ